MDLPAKSLELSSLIQMFHDVSWCFMMFPQWVRKVKSGETLWQKPTIGPCNCHSMFHPDESDDDHPAVQRNSLSPIVPMFGYTVNPVLHVKNEHKSIHIYTTCIYIYMHIYIYTHTCMHTYIHTYIHIYTYIHKYIHTYIHTYRHTYIHTDRHTYIHTYLYIYIYVLQSA